MVARVRERVEFVDHYIFPARALDAYRETHRSGLDPGQRDQLVSATRQWCRLLARETRTCLQQPSFAVSDYWRHLVSQPPEQDNLCAGAFGRVPDQSQPAAGTPSPGSAEAAGLHATYLMACADEESTPPHLPLLFRVDWIVDRLDARSYVPNCGEVRYCAATEGTICLQHLTVRPRLRRSRWGGAAAGGIGMSNRDAEGGFGGWGPP